MNHTILYHIHDLTSHWLHENSIPKIGCHYFWPGLIALPKNTLPIHIQSWDIMRRVLKRGKKGKY
jgi:hypothetical protein